MTNRILKAIYTDGSVHSSSNHSGWAAVFIYSDNSMEYMCGNNLTTDINKVELLAFYHALANSEGDVEIYSDSMYVVAGNNKYIVENKPYSYTLKYVDLWDAIKSVAHGRVVKVNHVKSHSNNEYNEIADHIARSVRTNL